MEKEWTTCCRGKDGCPEVAVDSEHIYIKDDHGGEIKVTASEFSAISKIIRDKIADLLSESLAENSTQSREALNNLFGKESNDARE